jgi:hypothetical protein
MAKTQNLQINIQLKPPKDVGLGCLKDHYVFAASSGKPDTVLGSVRTDEGGKAVLKLVVPGNVPPTLTLTLSPIPTLKSVRRVRTESVTVSGWKEKSGKGFEVSATFDPSTEFFRSVDWLHEQFTVEGVLVSQYTEPETGILREYPIQGARVGMYEVDKNYFGPCAPFTCIPRCEPRHLCVPDIQCTPTKICKPSVLNCEPVFEKICTPSVIIKGCGPWRFDGECGPGMVIDPGGLGEVINPATTQVRLAAGLDAGCCGSESRAAEAYRSGPSFSPRLAISPTNPISCLPADSICVPERIGPVLMGYSTSPLGGSEYTTGADGRFWFTFRRIDFFYAPSGTTHTEDLDWDEFPDLIFQARLWFDGADHLIYSEKPKDARWNIHDAYSFFKLVVQGQIPGAGPSDGIDLGQAEAFLFHCVGDIEPGWIDANGVINTPPAGHWALGHVFGATLEIRAQFAIAYADDQHYYQVEWRKVSGGSASDWSPVTGDSWYFSQYDSATSKWTTLTRSPQDMGGDFVACYPIPDYTDNKITRKDILLTWNSWRMDGNVPRYPDGIYQFRVRLLRKSGATVVPEPGFDPNAQILTLTIDNTWPTADIDGTLKLGTINASGVLSDVSDVRTCGFANAGGDRYLILPFTLQDPAGGKLCQYGINVNRGSDQARGLATLPSAWTQGPTAITVGGLSLVPAAASYPDASAPAYLRACAAFPLFNDPWTGNADLRPCAYNFSLWVYDRSTNGYGHIHWQECRATLTILGPGVAAP